MRQFITPEELQERRNSDSSLTVIDLRLADDFEAEHIEGAINLCIFEIEFLHNVHELHLDKAEPVCLYGACLKTREGTMAAEKMRRCGFRDLLVLRGGLEGWKEAGLPVVRGEPVAIPESVDGRYPVNLEESRVEWTGKNLINKHYGTVDLKDGELVFRQGQLTSGRSVLDMTRIRCNDLAGTELHDVLIDHLEGDDFFDVEHHPEATFVINGSTHIEEKGAGRRNIRVRGELTVRGITKPLDIEVVAGLTPEGKPAAQTSFSIDRTEWNIIYGSGSFFKRLAGHLVNDEIDFQLRILA